MKIPKRQEKAWSFVIRVLLLITSPIWFPIVVFCGVIAGAWYEISEWLEGRDENP